MRIAPRAIDLIVSSRSSLALAVNERPDDGSLIRVSATRPSDRQSPRSRVPLGWADGCEQGNLRVPGATCRVIDDYKACARGSVEIRKTSDKHGRRAGRARLEHESPNWDEPTRGHLPGRRSGSKDEADARLVAPQLERMTANHDNAPFHTPRPRRLGNAVGGAESLEPQRARASQQRAVVRNPKRRRDAARTGTIVAGCVAFVSTRAALGDAAKSKPHTAPAEITRWTVAVYLERRIMIPRVPQEQRSLRCTHLEGRFWERCRHPTGGVAESPAYGVYFGHRSANGVRSRFRLRSAHAVRSPRTTAVDTGRSRERPRARRDGAHSQRTPRGGHGQVESLRKRDSRASFVCATSEAQFRTLGRFTDPSRGDGDPPCQRRSHGASVHADRRRLPTRTRVSDPSQRPARLDRKLRGGSRRWEPPRYRACSALACSRFRRAVGLACADQSDGVVSDARMLRLAERSCQ